MYPSKTPTGQAYSGSMKFTLQVGMSNGLENSLQFLKMLNIDLTHDPAIPLLGIAKTKESI